MDFLALHRHADRLQSLDSMRFVTRGNPLKLRNQLFYMTPSVNQYGVFCRDDERQPAAAQILQEDGTDFGQLLYLLANEGTDSGTIKFLIEKLIKASGNWQAYFLAGDLLSDSPFLPVFKQLDFTIWARQNLYQFRGSPSSAAERKFEWRTWSSKDIRAMLSVYRSIVPCLFQTIEPLTRKEMLGMVLYDSRKTILGYADMVYGPNGIWVQPFLLPQADEPQIIIDLINALPPTFNRSIIFSLRSYQPWLKDLFDEAHFIVGPEKALLVKYLAIREKVIEPMASPVLEKARPETSLPYTPFQQIKR